MSQISVTEHTARWMLGVGERSPSLAFESFPPHYCKLCGDATPSERQRAHVKAHRDELNKATAKRRAESLRALKQANRLRREANHAA